MLFNSTLLGQCLCYMLVRRAWWRVKVDSKYGSSWGVWCSNEAHGSYGVGLWKNIKRSWGVFSSHARFEVGDGFKISFRHDL
jgi:hypothetical protein